MQNFRPINATNKIPSKEFEEAKVMFNDAYQLANIGFHQCLSIDNFILVKCEPGTEIEPDTTVQIKTPKRPKKDMSLEFDKELQSTIKEIQKKWSLFNYQIEKIKEDIEKVDTQFKQMELEKQKTYIEDFAHKIKLVYDKEKIYNDVMKKYQAFYESLNENLLELQAKEKEEIIIALGQLENIMKEYVEKLLIPV
ncbi:hypothetical protein [Sporosarcina koreensis]|uniref:Uncharacterized protein n=1 Tax=Sporosarcina koreensis TaxID=334735 RepID=A0ABW0U080_9BACL